MRLGPSDGDLALYAAVLLLIGAILGQGCMGCVRYARDHFDVPVERTP